MNVNPFKWFGTRELSTVPPHFVKASTILSDKAKLWVVSKLVGRYAIVSITEDTDFIPFPNDYIFFEDPSEAMMYELRWSGSK
jgi:hypothetical protein